MKQIVFIPFFFFLYSSLSIAQPDLKFPLLKSGFNSPVDIAHAGDDRLFIVEKNGYIKIIDEDGDLLTTPFLDIDSRVSSNGERGLLGLAFHPDYANNGYFYVNYSDNQGDTKISRFSKDPTNSNLADPNSEVNLIEIDQPQSNHNAGDIEFSPIDGYLYIPLGDGGGSGDPGNRSQNTACLLGKMLRIDVDGGINSTPASTSQTMGNCVFISTANYSIPNDNPFNDFATGNTDGILDEIWSIGLRNPWRFSFDSANGDMWIADVGQGQWEEVDYEVTGDGGKNYGWRCYEGTNDYNLTGCSGTYDDPIYEYDHDDGRSITGGFVYRGSEFPNLTGYYIMADYATDKVWALLKSGNSLIDTIVYALPDTIYSLSTFGVDVNNEMYMANLSDGKIYKIEDVAEPLPVELESFTGHAQKTLNKLNWVTISEENFKHFEIEKSRNGFDYSKVGTIEARGEAISNNKAYTFDDLQAISGSNYYRLKLVDRNGRFEYSKIIEIKNESLIAVSVFPNPNDGIFSMQSSGTIKGKTSVKIYNNLGELLVSENIDLSENLKKEYSLKQYAKGIYLFKFESDEYSQTIKLIYK